MVRITPSLQFALKTEIYHYYYVFADTLWLQAQRDRDVSFSQIITIF